ncbi:methyltransferase domain-containing protein [Treponema sp. OMZ 305]|uniref:cytidylyltransferase domain-containing protein n=1 Tax=Treponema sp. OMZ 305 TaxID=1659192 RepID=UPI0020A426C9|nr:methyltransferase domain-containing protein [Treponema sp. OMZ 305]UTC58314.1 methyltransferase domain-containing protein [Treponema sp. OMZ 305]
MSVYSGVAVVVQARLNSSRLPRKALLNLCGKPLLGYTLAAMREIPAERYILACDHASAAEFTSLAEQFHYTLISGSESDVLGRFCSVVKQFETSLRPITTVIRATGDNPFLFTEAAEASVKRFVELGEPDYFTYTGLPHGSGVEILKAKSLLTAERLTDDAYDHEHVGPALYRHTDTFICVKETAPLQWYAPHLRTTVDTQEDFDRAELMMQYLQREKTAMPPSSSAVMKACRYAGRIAVFVPSVREGQGTGHLRRACTLMQELSPQLRSVLYLSDSFQPPFVQDIIKKAGCIETVNEIPEQACVFILDNFRTQAEEVRQLKKIAPVVALDEGGEGRAYADYLIDILPTLPYSIDLTDVSAPKSSPDAPKTSNSSHTVSNRTVDRSEHTIDHAARAPDHSAAGEALRSNITEVSFIALPQKRKRDGALKKYEKNGKYFFPIENAKLLIVCGGEDAAHMGLPLAYMFAELGAEVSVVEPNEKKYSQKKVNLYVYPYLENLRNRLCEWDIIVTHYGFTAFEALAAGCAVILVSPTDYHYRLGLNAGFSTMPVGIPVVQDIKALFKAGIGIPSIVTPQSKEKSLADFILKLSMATAHRCPLCDEQSPLPPEGRAENKTVSRCPVCGMYYPSFIAAEKKDYSEQYFFEEYQAQYGKTYLEDFESIKRQGLRRMSIINAIYAKVFNGGKEESLFEGLHHGTKRILDVGCAYGPFLAAAKESGWNPVGTDISAEAVHYVCKMLQLPACQAPFPVLPARFPFTVEKTFTEQHNQSLSIPLESGGFSAVTMWFVIEHFQDLNSVLQKVSDLLIGGGIFAFSTPALSGVTGRWNRRLFFAQSPTDHYTIWDRRQAKKQLERYGFTVKKIVSIGHHPERFPHAAKIKKGGFRWNILMLVSKLFKLGDSMELYAVKQGAFDD